MKGAMILVAAIYRYKGTSVAAKLENSMGPGKLARAATPNIRRYTSYQLTKSMELLSSDTALKVNRTPSAHVTLKEARPLALLLPWLMAKRGALMKYADVYLGQGCDVLITRVTPLEVLWPINGAKPISRDLISFLHLSTSYSPIVLHGFSVGGYLWGETMGAIKENLQLYQPIVDRIAGHIWDSLGGVEEIKVAFPVAMFPNNKCLQKLSSKCIKYHMDSNYETVTRHYHKAFEMLSEQTLVRTPGLVFLSRTDPLGTVAVAEAITSSWQKSGIEFQLKIWESSPHVQHFMKHRQEYTQLWGEHLIKCGFMRHPRNFTARL